MYKGYTLSEYEFTGISEIFIFGGATIDELRIFPNGSFVNSSTYYPSIGIRTHTDPNNKTTYYEYDSFNRLSTLRNQDGNIVKKICYKYSGQQEDCGLFYNIIMSQSFTKNDCPSGQVGSSVLFTVPSGMFSSGNNQADADLMALNYINANGQTYANSIGTCTITCNNCTTPNKKCINGICETGIKVITDNGCNVIYINYPNDYEYDCWETYHFEFSDGTWSQDYTCWNNNNCQ